MEENLASISMKSLLEAGVHFGHKSANWNPRMKKYIFMKRKGVHIIDLQQTLSLVEEAYSHIRNMVANGGNVLFVGTKKQAKASIQEHAIRCQMPYVSNRWIGGLLTNFKTVKQSISKLKKLEALLANEEEKASYTKKELIGFTKKLEKLEKTFGGIKDMKKLPDVIFLVDSEYENIAVQEAKKMHIPVVALVDTNANPDLVDVVIPGNDDAIRAVNLFVSFIGDGVIEGLSMRPDFKGELPPTATVAVDESEDVPFTAVLDATVDEDIEEELDVK